MIARTLHKNLNQLKIKTMKKIITLLALVFCTYANAQIISTYAGTGASGFSGDGGQATSAILKNPDGVAVDAQGNIYISDSFNSRIRKVNASTGVITTVAGTGSYGFSGDGGLAIAAKMTYPSDIAVDSQSNLYIADNARIRKVTVSTGIITTIAGNGTGTPTGDGGLATAAQLQEGQMTFDSQGSLYISAGNRIRKIDATTGIITTVAGTGTVGFSGDGGPATSAKLYATGGIVVDANNNLYIADQGNFRVRKVDGATGIITTICGSINNYFGDGGLATAAELTGPNGLVLDAQGNLYIADQPNHRIRKIDGSTGIITTIAGNGNGNFSGDGGPATAAELFFPKDLAMDAQGNLYITEGYASSSIPSYRVRKISNSITGIEQFSNSKDQVSIYPNPSAGLFNISTTVQFTEVKVYDQLGEVVAVKETGGLNTIVELNNSHKGVYFYQILNKGEIIKTGKLIVE